MGISITAFTLQREFPSLEQTLAINVPHDQLSNLCYEAGRRGVAGLRGYTLDRATYEVTCSNFIKVAELQEAMGLPVLEQTPTAVP